VWQGATRGRCFGATLSPFRRFFDRTVGGLKDRPQLDGTRLWPLSPALSARRAPANISGHRRTTQIFPPRASCRRNFPFSRMSRHIAAPSDYRNARRISAPRSWDVNSPRFAGDFAGKAFRNPGGDGVPAGNQLQTPTNSKRHRAWPARRPAAAGGRGRFSRPATMVPAFEGKACWAVPRRAGEIPAGSRAGLVAAEMGKKWRSTPGMLGEGVGNARAGES